MRYALVLRPNPGGVATVRRLVDSGIRAVALPLFEVEACAWTMPPGAFDALLLTSANSVRHAGARLPRLPVVAVGAATAAAARAAGREVILTGNGDAASAVAQAGGRRLLHLAGREHVAVPGVVAVTVYASDAVAVAPGAIDVALDAVVLLHSQRAAARFVELAAHLERGRIRVAALSRAVAEVAGAGFERVAVAERPDDDALVAVAKRLAIDP